MADEGERKIRKGTKSCIECRQRKIRCMWASEDADVCNNCAEKRRKCVPQQILSKDPSALRLTSRERISKLEGNVASLWKLVRHLETKLSGPDGASSTVLTEVPDATDASGVAGAQAGYESDSSESCPPAQPSHLRQLFQGGPLDWQEQVDAETPQQYGPHASYQRLKRARDALRALLPSRDDTAVIAAHSTSWLALVDALFAINYMPLNEAQILTHWDAVQDDDVHPGFVAILLMTLATTALSTPPAFVWPTPSGRQYSRAFAERLSRGVDKFIIQDDHLVASVQGLEAAVIWARLEFIHGKTTKLWLALRRMQALAELIGLPRAVNKRQSSFARTPPDESVRKADGVALWRALCTVDRFVSMMFNTPAGTLNYPLILNEPIIQDGEFLTKNYMVRLADVAPEVQEIDNMHADGVSSAELCGKVLAVDQRLRQIASLAPPSFWATTLTEFKATSIVQQFHQYLTARTHLQLALRNGASSEYAYSDVICTQACMSIARRYSLLRKAMPSGFFACRFVDLQLITAAVFLVHRRHFPPVVSSLPTPQDTNEIGAVLDRVLETADWAAAQTGGDFAGKVAQTIRSMNALLDERPNGTAHPHTLTMRVPLLGRVTVRRRQGSVGTPSQPLAAHGDTTPTSMSVDDLSAQQPNNNVWAFGAVTTSSAQPPRNYVPSMGSSAMPWSMEISEVLPFLSNDMIGTEYWDMFDTAPVPDATLVGV